MNRAIGKYIGLAFAACFVVMQLHQIGFYEPTKNDAPIFYLEEASTPVLDRSIKNSFAFIQYLTAKQKTSFQHEAVSKQLRQYQRGGEQQAMHPFEQLMLECIDVLYQSHDLRLLTLYHHLQLLELSFELNPLFIAGLKLIYSDDSAPSILS